MNYAFSKKYCKDRDAWIIYFRGKYVAYFLTEYLADVYLRSK